MAGRTVVVDTYHGVVVFLDQSAHEVVGALLHLWIGALHGIELNTVGVASGIDRRNGAATKTDAIVVATDHYDLIALLGLAFQTVALLAVAYAAGKHNHLVITQTLAVATMLKGEHRAGDKGLAKLVAEV